MCRSDLVEGFTFDRTGHLLHLRHPRVRRLIGRLLAGELIDHLRDTWIYSHGVHTRYPFQAHFHGLPPEVAAECLEGVFEAHYRLSKRPGRKGPGPERFSDWALARFGPGVARHFLFPYNEKLWTVPPSRLTSEWIGRFVPRPDLRQVVLGALADRVGEEGYNARFLYPRVGGIESLVRALARGVKQTLTGVEVRAIDLKQRRLQLSSGDRIQFGQLVSCAPLPDLIARIQPLPDRLRLAARRLKAASVYNLNLGIRDRGERRHWVYVPEERFGLYRFGFASNFSDTLAPPGCAAVYTELAWRRGSRFDRAGARRKILADLQRIGVIRSRSDVILEHPLELDVAYAIYDRHRTRAVGQLTRFLQTRGIHPIGRWGRWEYGSMEDALLQGLELADKLLKRQGLSRSPGENIP
jgi:protoporphyrinogen oxidase